MFERPRSGEKALLVHMRFSQSLEHDNEEREFVELVTSAQAQVLTLISGYRQLPESRYFVGSGKAEEIQQQVQALNADLVIFDHPLSPAQERNLEHLFQCRVLDRTGLILDIFAQRARSHEGKLQVELAQLRHLSTRLVRGWTHLERQKGGIGLRGPGETQLETDRRLLSIRIKQITKRLEKVQKQREQGRQARRKAELPTLSLVGYTNAGKSTLFNRLTASDVYAADQLFATLDPTFRRVDLPGQQSVILADTVGFIRNLPHDLVAAFRATLMEVQEADLLLHVIDANDDERDVYRDQVNQVIKEIDAENVPQVEIYNKIDLLGQAPRIEAATDGSPTRVWLSAQEDMGLERLATYLSDYFSGQRFQNWVQLSPNKARLRARFYEEKAVEEEHITENGDFHIQLNIRLAVLKQLLRSEDISLKELTDT